MSANNELVILVRKKIEVHINFCVDNDFVPSQNTLLKKFDELLNAIRYANNYCDEKMIEYGFRLDYSCFDKPLNDIGGIQRVDNFPDKDSFIIYDKSCYNKSLAEKEYHFGLESPFAYGFRTSDIKRFIEEIKNEFMRRFYGSDISNKDYEEYLKFIDDKAGDLK